VTQSSTFCRSQRKSHYAEALASRNEGRTSPWPWRCRRIVLIRCAELYTLLPRTRIDQSSSFNRLRNAGLRHFFLDCAEGCGAKCDFLTSWHNTIIMSRTGRQERSIQTRVSRFWRCILGRRGRDLALENPYKNLQFVIPVKRY
jgi:hypothetical protein